MMMEQVCGRSVPRHRLTWLPLLSFLPLPTYLAALPRPGWVRACVSAGVWACCWFPSGLPLRGAEGQSDLQPEGRAAHLCPDMAGRMTPEIIYKIKRPLLCEKAATNNNNNTYTVYIYISQQKYIGIYIYIYIYHIYPYVYTLNPSPVLQGLRPFTGSHGKGYLS